MSFNSGSNPFATQFGLKAKIPLDCRFVITDVTELIQLIHLGLYPGLRFVLTSDVTIDDASMEPALLALSVTKAELETLSTQWSSYKKTYAAGFYLVKQDGVTIVSEGSSEHIIYDSDLKALKFVFPE